MIAINNNDGREEEIDLETYLIGVLAAEMPANFEEEALKAQAVAARTYTLKHMEDKQKIKAIEIQKSYHNQTKMKEKRGKEFAN